MWKDIGNFLSDKKVNKKSKITDVVVEEAVIIDVGSANVDKEAQHSSNVNSEEETFNRVSKKLKLGSSFIILGILFLGLAGVGFLILPKHASLLLHKHLLLNFYAKPFFSVQE